jgi:uncharacterized protein YbcI
VRPIALSAAQSLSFAIVRELDSGDQEVAVSGRMSGAASGRLNQQIANVIVRSRKAFLGHGPTKAQAFYHDNVVVVLMEDYLTEAERRVASHGGSDALLSMHVRYQQTMRPEIVSAVEGLTGCRVDAFIAGNHISPDLAAELFVLDRPVVAHIELPIEPSRPDDGAKMR